MIALDQQGNLAAACTTSGAAFKLPGRVGDSPLIGSGLYADNDAGAAAATGRGEEITRTCGSFAVVEHIRHGKSPQEACEAVVQHLIARVPSARPYQMAYIAIDKYGNWVQPQPVLGFYRLLPAMRKINFTKVDILLVTAGLDDGIAFPY